MRVSLIVARAANGVIGREGELPWRLSADLQRFKKLTMGHHLIMGRRTFESIGRVLPGRVSIVLSRTPAYEAPGALVAASLDEALLRVSGDNEVFVIGGHEVFREALPLASRLYITDVEAEVEGDVLFPETDPSQWQLIDEDRHEADERNEHDYTFRIYDRLLEDRPPEPPAPVQDPEAARWAAAPVAENLPRRFVDEQRNE